MKKFIKTCLIAGIITLIVGGAITIAAASFGASIWDIAPDEAAFWKRTFSDISFKNMDLNDGTDYLMEFQIKEPDQTGEEIYVTDQARSLSAEVRGGKVFLKEDPNVDGITIYCNKENGNWDIKEKNGKLKLTVGEKPMEDNSDLIITVSVPEEFHFSDLDLEVSRKKGFLKKEKSAPILSARSIKADEMDLEVNAGILSIEEGDVKNLTFENSVGAVVYDGNATGDIKGECNVGAVKLNLSGEKEDYNYQVECRLGEIKIGQEQISAVNNEVNYNNMADKNINLECNTGAIEVNFTH